MSKCHPQDRHHIFGFPPSHSPHALKTDVTPIGGEAGEKRVSLPVLAFRYQLTAAAVRQALVASQGIDSEQAAAMWPSDDDVEEAVDEAAQNITPSSAARIGNHYGTGTASGAPATLNTHDLNADDEDEGRHLDDQKDLDGTIDRQYAIVSGRALVGSARARSSRSTTAAATAEIVASAKTPFVTPSAANREVTNRPVLTCTSLVPFLVTFFECSNQ